ncbi:hypothetical protein N324_10836, partial [Chlamydotis macqueenii]
MSACNQGKWDRALAEVVAFHFYLLVKQNGVVVKEKYILGHVFCYYMTQSACGYSKQCAEILFSGDKNSSSSASSRAFTLDSDTFQQSGEPLSRTGKWQETKSVATCG